MKRFVKEYANYKLANCPFLPNSVCGQLYNQRITSAIRVCEKGFITVDEAMQMIANTEQYAEQEDKTE